MSESRLLQLHDYLVLIGEIEPCFENVEEREAIALLETKGLIESPNQILTYLQAKQVQESDWVREPVPVKEWMNDPYYTGPFAGQLFPKIQEDMIEIFDPHRVPQVMEVVATGAIGWGKSMAAGMCMGRQIYELSCLREPHKVLGTSPGTDIVLINLSVTGNQAKNAIYKYVFRLIDESDYFKEHYQRDESIDSEIRFRVDGRDTGVVYRPGNSRETSTIGTNVISGAIDEANFMVSSSLSAHEKLQGDVEHALVLYRALIRRIESRFKFSKGFKGRLFLCSSKMYKGDFLDQHIAEVAHDPSVKVMDYSHWDVRSPDQFCGEKFRIVVGAAGVRSRILRDEDRVSENARVIEVPVEYRVQFEKDLEGCVRDIAGVSTLAMRPMMDPQAVMRQQATEFEGHPLIHPFADDTSGVYSDQIVLNVEALCHKVEVEEGGKKVKILRPRRNPEASRFIHVDLALRNDAAGFAMGYIAGEKEVVTWNKDTDSEEKEMVPIVVYEILGSFVAPVGDEIRGSQIRSLIYQLRDLGFYIACVSFDQYQSADSRQILSEHGFTVEEVSVDRDANAYEVLRDGLRDGWVFYYPHKTAERELLKIERVIRKRPGGMQGKVAVDHPERDMDNKRTGLGSKDVADSMAAVAWYILHHYTSVGSLIAPSAGLLEGDGKTKQVLAKAGERSSHFDPDENWTVGPRL